MWIKDGILVLKKVIYKIRLNWGSLSIKEYYHKMDMLIYIWFRGLALLHSCESYIWYFGIGKAYWTSYKRLTDKHIFNEDLIVSWIKILFGVQLTNLFYIHTSFDYNLFELFFFP